MQWERCNGLSERLNCECTKQGIGHAVVERHAVDDEQRRRAASVSMVGDRKLHTPQAICGSAAFVLSLERCGKWRVRQIEPS